MGDVTDLLVMGATGRIGRALRQIWSHRRDVLWQGRSETRDRPNWIVWHPGMALPEVQTIVLLAGTTQGPPEVLAENTEIALAVLDAAEAAGVRRLLLASSMAVYGETRPEGACENTPPAPLRPYGAAKLAMEQAALAQSRKTEVCALRIGNVIGAGPLWTAIAEAEDGTRNAVTLDRFGDGTSPFRSHVGPVLLSRCLHVLSRHPAALPAHLNIALPVPQSMQALAQAAGVAVDWIEAPAGAIHHATMKVDRLSGLDVFEGLGSDAGSIVAEWRSFGKTMQ